jgi:hypothetical protein
MAYALGPLIRLGPVALRVRAGTRLAALFLLCVLASLGAVAQPGSNYPLVRFTVFAAKGPAELGFVPRPGAAPQKLQFYPTARSPRYEYRGPLPLRILDLNNGQVVAEAAIVPGTSDVLLLLTPLAADATGAAGSKLRYQVAVLDDGAIRHGPGGLVIVNLSGLELSGTVGKEAVTLKPGFNPPLTLAAATKVAFTSSFKGRPYPAYSGTVTLKRNERALLLLFPPFYKGSLEVQSRLLIDTPPGMAPAKR